MIFIVIILLFTRLKINNYCLFISAHIIVITYDNVNIYNQPKCFNSTQSILVYLHRDKQH